jgi:hypothetical protein
MSMKAENKKIGINKLLPLNLCPLYFMVSPKYIYELSRLINISSIRIYIITVLIIR